MSNKNITECLKVKKITLYKSELQVVKGNSLTSTDNSSMDIILIYKNQEKTITEEILVYDTPGMVAQIGGILSLFLGFSFFSILCDIMELVQKLKIKQKWKVWLVFWKLLFAIGYSIHSIQKGMFTAN